MHNVWDKEKEKHILNMQKIAYFINSDMMKNISELLSSLKTSNRRIYQSEAKQWECYETCCFSRSLQNCRCLCLYVWLSMYVWKYKCVFFWWVRRQCLTTINSLFVAIQWCNDGPRKYRTYQSWCTRCWHSCTFLYTAGTWRYQKLKLDKIE